MQGGASFEKECYRVSHIFSKTQAGEGTAIEIRKAGGRHFPSFNLKTKKPSLFWKWINTKTKAAEPSPIATAIYSFEDHFRSLNEGPPPDPARSTERFSTDGEVPISVEELDFALNKLKKNKAPGWDGLVPSLYKCFDTNLRELLRALFNRVMETGSYPTQWSRGIIRPIHKSESKNDPSNYRGITLLNIVGKLFTSILNQRLLDWAESTNLINEA